MAFVDGVKGRRAIRARGRDIGQAGGRVGEGDDHATAARCRAPFRQQDHASRRQGPRCRPGLRPRPGLTAVAAGSGQAGRRMPSPGRMGLRGGPAGLRHRLVEGEGRAIELGQFGPARIVGPDDEDRAVMAGRAAFDPVIGGADIGDAVMQPGAVGVAAGLRQTEDRAPPRRANRRPRHGVRASGAAKPAARSPSRISAQSRSFAAISAEIIHPKGGDHSWTAARSARCRACADSTSVSPARWRPCASAGLRRVAQSVGQGHRPERGHQVRPVVKSGRGLEGLGEAHGVGGRSLDLLGLGAQSCRLERADSPWRAIRMRSIFSTSSAA
jgi:hypothetical protein